MRPNARACFIVTFAAACVLLSQVAAAQSLTGTLIGTIRDEQGAAIPGVRTSITSPALLGGRRSILTSVELVVDVLNVLNETAEEELATDNSFSSNFRRPTIFTDPRRAMFGVRLNLGRQ
jgi:hypothetical protein